VIVRDIQAYHLSLGYFDIAYQFLVDRYGQIFEGRAAAAPALGVARVHSSSVRQLEL
jgi:hypothetical protein